MSKIRKFIDIGANLTDSMYAGIYNGSKKHEEDLVHVLNRSWRAGLQKIIITGGNLHESKKALEIAKTDEKLFCTVGCHPTRCYEFEESGNAENYLNDLRNLIVENRNKVVAIGECGLDYDRIKFCPIDIQKKYFAFQLQLCKETNLPLFLHCRNAAQDLFEILKRHQGFRGVVHSFDGTISEAESFIELGYHIGLNGCSLKTQENLETVKKLPVDKIVIESDCPWCEIRPSHAGFHLINKRNVYESVKKEKWNENAMVKSRNEPANIAQVLDIIAAIKQFDIDLLNEQIYKTTVDIFFNA